MKQTTNQVHKIHIGELARIDDDVNCQTVMVGGLPMPVQLTTSPCNYGKHRHWFVCPRCKGRAGVLYYSHGLGCRKCHKLAYPIENETDYDRAHRKANDIRRRLGWRVGIAHPMGRKPIGRHWKTFSKLVLKHNRYVDLILTSEAKFLELIDKQKRKLLSQDFHKEY